MTTARVIRRFVVVIVLFLGALSALGAATEPDDPALAPPAASSAYSHDELQRAADMTQQMSAPNAGTGSQSHAGDEQLRRSQSSGYVAAVEQHQADIDEMLARGSE